MPLYPSLAYQASGEGTYSGTIAWTGSAAPSSTETHQYTWTRIGDRVFLDIFLYYASAGTALTAVTLTLPTGIPAPKQWTGKDAANLSQYCGDAQFFTGDSAQSQAIRTGMLRNTDQISCAISSGNYKHALFQIQYRTEA